MYLCRRPASRPKRLPDLLLRLVQRPPVARLAHGRDRFDQRREVLGGRALSRIDLRPDQAAQRLRPLRPHRVGVEARLPGQPAERVGGLKQRPAPRVPLTRQDHRPARGRRAIACAKGVAASPTARR